MNPSDANQHDADGIKHDAAIALAAFLESRLEILVDRSIEVAKQNGYAPFTTTIRAAWVEAILSVTESLRNYLTAETNTAPGPQATLDYRSDPRFARMRKIARQHRSLGITMPMYVGLLKHFRNIYIAELGGLPGGARPALVNRVRDFFDETELSISADWHNSDDNIRLREMQERALAITLDKDRYFAIFESLRSPAFLLGKSQRLLNANQAAAELFLGDAQAGEIIFLRSMRQRKRSLQEVIARIMDAASESERSVWLDTLAGNRCFDVRIRALHDAVENIAIGYVVLLNDVTEHRRATEQAQQAERNMSRFLATMSHEIRTPLHSVLGATELLRTAEEGNAHDYLNLIENAGQTLLQTLNNVLDYSKLNNDPPEPHPVAVNFARAIKAFGQVVEIGSSREKARLSFDISANVPCDVLIDWAMTRQVLSNLVTNAIRADKGEGVIVTILRVGDDRPALRFEVRDHGPGIPAEDAELLFRPFEKVTARETGSGGAGLGLAIAHHLVEAMQGRIGYRNCDRGALIWFEVPFDANAEPPSDTLEAPAFLPTTSANTLRCLLVDDDPIGSTVTRLQLERLGLRVDQSATVAGTLDAAARIRFDVFVVDYMLPDGDGPTLVQDLRRRLPGGSRYFALTANVEALKDNKELRDVFDGVLAKPVDLQKLSSVLNAPVRISPAPTGQDRTAALDGLSPDTVSAMTKAFHSAWQEFRKSLRKSNDGQGAPDLAYQAHRLMGSAAILGIHELETPLRELERRWPERSSDEGIIPLMASLDRDLAQLKSWVRVCGEADRQ